MRSKPKSVFGILIIIGISFTIAYKWQSISNTNLEKMENKNLFLPIYTVNFNTYDTEILDSIEVGKDSSLEDNLKAISVHLSGKVFYNLPILIDSIEVQNGKKVLYVNLKETIGKMKWNRNLFQGSTGGYHTSITLRETFLQKDYIGEWVDGVHFSYEGIPITNTDYDHIGALYDIKWRDTTSLN